MAYAESESMALKRLKVALKRKDWQFFEYGISRTNEMINSGTKISEIQQWYELLDTAKKENAPEAEIIKLSTIIEGILTPAQSNLHETKATTEPEHYEMPDKQPVSSIEVEDLDYHKIPDSVSSYTEAITQEEPAIYNADNQFTTESYTPMYASSETIVDSTNKSLLTKTESKKIPLTIFINKNISSDQTKLIDSIRYDINKLGNENDANINFKFLSTLSNLLVTLQKEEEEIEILIKLLKTCPEPGVIITSCYSSILTNLLIENNIDFSIDKIKEPQTTNYWKIYPLRGSSSIFWCPKCKNKTFYNNDEKTLVTTCNKCSEPAYPDLYAINANNPQTEPKSWYHAYGALTNSENWLLISPPKNSENEIIHDLISTALCNTELKQAYIVSNDSKTRDHWNNNFNKTNDLSISCSSLFELINNHLNI